MQLGRPTMAVDILFSGGLDSTALMAFYLRQNFDVRALFVDFGQAAAKQELNAARSLCKYYGVPLSVFYARHQTTLPSGEITGRNAFLIFAALLVCERLPALIALGIHQGSPYYDCSDSFLQSTQTIIDGYTGGSVKVTAPFLKWDKPMIWAFCKEAKVPIDLTYSCEKGGVHPCGKCLSCKDRELLYAL